MQIRTLRGNLGQDPLGVARSLGWKVHMRCANGYRLETRSMRRCVYRKQLDLETLCGQVTAARDGPRFLASLCPIQC
jgi:hypothetical protein